MMKKQLLIAAVLVTIVGAGLFTATTVSAQTNNPMSSLVQKIAQKFGLKESDVQAVFDQDRQDRKAQMESNYKNRLDQYVKDGKITASQEQLILDKHKELETNRQNEMQNFKNLTLEQRRTQMQQEKQDLENWAKQNGIDLQYLMPRGFGPHGHGFKMMHSVTVTPTP